MEAVVPLIFDNLDIILTVCFMLYPFLSVLWESCKLPQREYIA